MSLTNKTALVTGSTSGIGLGIAIALAEQGANIILNGFGEIEPARSAIARTGVRVGYHGADLSRAAEIIEMMQYADAEFGGVDVLVNNAAVTVSPAWSKRFLDLPLEEWLYQFDVNLHAPFILMQLVTPIMERRGGGRIINITTGNGEVFRHSEEPTALEANAGRNLIMPGYFASKRALDRLGNVIAPDLAPRNIYVIGMHPGWVASEVVQARLEKVPASEERVTEGPIPMTVPARMIVYFASCENPREYTGRLFWAEREMAEMGIALDGTVTALASGRSVGDGEAGSVA
jgi:NAD(P)-dependent dehydrogenase (short-subunit alcohol dehydrogenase family)